MGWPGPRASYWMGRRLVCLVKPGLASWLGAGGPRGREIKNISEPSYFGARSCAPHRLACNEEACSCHKKKDRSAVPI